MVTTDIIVGFQGETDDEFQSGLICGEDEFFAYACVPLLRCGGTPAAERQDQVPEPVKKDRVHRMQALAARKAEEFHRQFIGRDHAFCLKRRRMDY